MGTQTFFLSFGIQKRAGQTFWAKTMVAASEDVDERVALTMHLEQVEERLQLALEGTVRSNRRALSILTAGERSVHVPTTSVSR